MSRPSRCGVRSRHRQHLDRVHTRGLEDLRNGRRPADADGPLSGSLPAQLAVPPRIRRFVDLAQSQDTQPCPKMCGRCRESSSAAAAHVNNCDKQLPWHCREIRSLRRGNRQDEAGNLHSRGGDRAMRWAASARCAHGHSGALRPGCPARGTQVSILHHGAPRLRPCAAGDSACHAGPGHAGVYGIRRTVYRELGVRARHLGGESGDPLATARLSTVCGAPAL